MRFFVWSNGRFSPIDDSSDLLAFLESSLSRDLFSSRVIGILFVVCEPLCFDLGRLKGEEESSGQPAAVSNFLSA